MTLEVGGHIVKEVVFIQKKGPALLITGPFLRKQRFNRKIPRNPSNDQIPHINPRD